MARSGTTVVSPTALVEMLGGGGVGGVPDWAVNGNAARERANRGARPNAAPRMSECMKSSTSSEHEKPNY
jgi:hypothetical protein